MAQAYRLDNSIMYWLHLAFSRLRTGHMQALSEAGYELTPEQWALLARLWEGDGLAQTELAAATHRDPASVTRMVDALSIQGWVERQQDPDDRRRHLVVLTAEGRAVRDELVPLVRRFERRAFRDLDRADRSELRRVLGLLFEALD